MKYILTILCVIALGLGFSGDVQAQANSNEIGNFTEVANSGISGADNPSNPNGVRNLVRSWLLNTGFDLDSDGRMELGAFDPEGVAGSGGFVYFIYESTGPRGTNDIEAVFTVPAISPQFGNERGMLAGTDLDHDGNKELIIIWDSFAPDSTDGHNALWVYEHVPGSGFLPATPDLTYDPPRSTVGTVRMEAQCLAGDFDLDGNTELVLTYRGGKDMLIAVLEFEGADIATGTFNVEFTDDGSPDGSSGTTAGDSTAFFQQVHGLNVGDLNNDGRPDLVMIPDVTKRERTGIRVYTTTGTDAWEMTRFDQTDLPPIYVTAQGSNAKPGIADFNGDESHRPFFNWFHFQAHSLFYFQ